ncbi:type I-E CRISPR-associated protein Cas5/CasD [Streptomyces sp. NPDC015032]|uniref:type I-E CRISPR-associated protein Cas5/CasD n=1 Tax=Streptomyces sp. NPDC015032 TaxID=3364937 RepID=UPI0036FE99F8
MPTVLLRLSGPMQAYGTSSHWEERATRSRPTKSATVGLIANALGLDLNAPLNELAQLVFTVRADRPGMQMTDQQTAGGGTFPANAPGLPAPDTSALYGAPRDPVAARDGSLRTSSKKGSRGAVLITKHYLADAAFLAGLSSANEQLLRSIDHALHRPARLLFLGRRSCPPAFPVAHGTTPHGPDQWPSHVPLLPEATTTRPTVWTETLPSAGAVPSPEQPPATFAHRMHATMFLRTSAVQPPPHHALDTECP